MSKENMEKFYQELSHNQKWQEKLKKATDVETFTKLIAELAKEKGYTFTIEQVEVATTEKIENGVASIDLWEELPDEQLEAVAGGLGVELSDYLNQLRGLGKGSKDKPPIGGPWCSTAMKQKTKYCA
jgi:predicted ribosomally synthesized peptide with nif11-like leader